MLEFLIDESCDAIIVRQLRDAGYDVLYVAEDSAGLPDEKVAQKAFKTGRILLTEDRDFGHYVFASSGRQVGVIYLRYPFFLKKKIAARVSQLINSKKENLKSKFVVVQPGKIRIRNLP
ncbi:MAG: DUF5615 family PIN-like protein [bacterium]